MYYLLNFQDFLKVQVLIQLLHSNKYLDIAKSTKASYCVTTAKLKDNLPKTCEPIVVENVLLAISMITQKLYPNSVEDEFDRKVKNIASQKSCDTKNSGFNCGILFVRDFFNQTK